MRGVRFSRPMSAIQARSEFNAKHPKETLVNYWLNDKIGIPNGRAKTRGYAYVDGGEAVVLIDGLADAIPLSLIDVVTGPISVEEHAVVPAAGQFWQHAKGGFYHVIGMAALQTRAFTPSLQDQEPMVVYKACAKPDLFVRTQREFLERFKPLDSNPCAMGATRDPVVPKPLSQHAIDELREIRRRPFPLQDLNPGVKRKLLDEDLIETFDSASPYAVHKGAMILFARITEKGRIAIEDEPGGDSQ